jgi:hypothetical protein
MATKAEQYPDEPVDPIDEELEALLADPEISASLDDFLERERRGELGPGIPHEEVRRRIGLAPVDEDDDA